MCGDCAPLVGNYRAALDGRALARGKDQDFKRSAKGEDGETKTDVSAAMSRCIRLAGHLRAWQRQTPHANETDFGSVVQSQVEEAALLICIRRRLSATGRKESRSTHRGRPTVRTSQLASQLKQLAGEQGESRAENRSGNPASRKIQTTLDLIRRRQQRNTGRAEANCWMVGRSAA